MQEQDRVIVWLVGAPLQDVMVEPGRQPNFMRSHHNILRR